MRVSRIVVPLVAALGAPLLLTASADAQLGLSTLPKNDFVWNWGRAPGEVGRRGVPDLEISGNESFFHCDLTAQLRPSSSMSPTEIREIEMELRTRMDFIYAVSEYMNYFERNIVLDWATLDCKRQEGEEPSAETRAERESDARDKMLRELERRRERQQRDND
jgi:hypothetical protein